MPKKLTSAIPLHRSAWATPALLSALMFMGCGGAPASDSSNNEPTASNERTATKQASLSLGRGLWSWGTANGPDLDIGSYSTQTCFLSGVAGDLNSGYQWYSGQQSFAGVYYGSNGNYKLSAWGGRWDDGSLTNNAVNAHVTCIGTTANRIEGYWETNGSPSTPTKLGPVTPNRQCFLESVWGAGGTWVHPTDNVRVTNDGVNWWLSGTVSSDPYSGSHAGATAVCVDLPAGTWVGTGAWGVSDPGSLNVNVGWDSSGMICALTGIQGHFNDSSWTDGATISWPSASPGWWTMSLVNGKTGWVTCIE